MFGLKLVWKHDWDYLKESEKSLARTFKLFDEYRCATDEQVEALESQNNAGNELIAAYKEWNEALLDTIAEVDVTLNIADAVTNHWDSSLWAISYVEMLIKEYEKEHQWDKDEDPIATADAIGIAEEMCAKVRTALKKLERDNQ